MNASDEPRPATGAVSGKGSQPASRRLTARKKALFALVAACCFFGLLELALAIFGVEPWLRRHDPFVGFAPDVPLFVPQTRQDGHVVLVTAPNKLKLFNQQAFPLAKPANTVRVFCVGGSTTRGFPFEDSTSFCGWLREFLPIVAPSRNWEVINAGASSYASYRVVRVMEELCQYSPDLFIVYSGHNEFMERRTYGNLINASDVVLAAEAMAMRTRVYTALEHVVRTLSGNHKGKDGDATVLGSDLQALAAMEQVIGWDDYSRDDGHRQEILRHCRFNLDRMIELARGASAEILLIVPACNLLHWSPYKSERRAGLSEQAVVRCQVLLQKAEKAQGSGDLQVALDACDACLQIDDRYALAHYIRGQILHALGQYSAAKVALERARDEDVCPLRALSVIQQIVLDTAAKHKVPVLDFAQVVEDDSGHGIAGEKHFFDDVHPNVATHRLLATELLETLSKTGLVPSKPNWDRASMQKVAEVIEGLMDQDKRAFALIEVSRTHSWAGQWEESVRLARQALEQSPQFGEATTNLADIHWKFGIHLLKQHKSAAAAKEFREVVRLMPNNSAARQQLRFTEQLIDEK